MQHIWINIGSYLIQTTKPWSFDQQFMICIPARISDLWQEKENLYSIYENDAYISSDEFALANGNGDEF